MTSVGVPQRLRNVSQTKKSMFPTGLGSSYAGGYAEARDGQDYSALGGDNEEAKMGGLTNDSQS